MTPGLNLLLALFLLAPGFGAFAGVYVGGLQRPFRPAPAAPGSLLALALVTTGALAAHTLGAAVYAIQDLGCAPTDRCWSLPFQPNPYATLSDIRGRAGELAGVSVAVVLFNLLLVTMAGYGVGRWGMGAAVKSPRFQKLFYGWAVELIELAPTRLHVVNAFIVTDIEHEGASVGYEGVLVDLRQDVEGQIKSAALRDVQTFLLKITKGRVDRQNFERNTPIPFLVLEADNIKNVAMTIYFDTKRLADLMADVDAGRLKLPEGERKAIEAAVQAALDEAAELQNSDVGTPSSEPPEAAIQ